jgi:hypothetical protein
MIHEALSIQNDLREKTFALSPDATLRDTSHRVVSLLLDALRSHGRKSVGSTVPHGLASVATKDRLVASSWIATNASLESTTITPRSPDRYRAPASTFSAATAPPFPFFSFSASSASKSLSFASITFG